MSGRIGVRTSATDAHRLPPPGTAAPFLALQPGDLTGAGGPPVGTRP
jgi:hypothetical protein